MRSEDEVVVLVLLVAEAVGPVRSGGVIAALHAFAVELGVKDAIVRQNRKIKKYFKYFFRRALVAFFVISEVFLIYLDF